MAVNPSDAIIIPAGKDQLGRIDDPDGANNRRDPLAKIWADNINKIF